MLSQSDKLCDLLDLKRRVASYSVERATMGTCLLTFRNCTNRILRIIELGTPEHRIVAATVYSQDVCLWRDVCTYI